MGLFLKMKNEIKTPIIIKILMVVAFIAMVLIIFLQQLKVPFMLEDIYYSKNLVTGEPIKGISDIFQSAGCIFYWKGGSVIAGFLLQVILISGGYVADILNILVMIGCALLIFAPAKASHQRIFFTVFAFLMLICLNANWSNSYFRQFMTVYFFYPSLLMLSLLKICTAILDAPNPVEKISVPRIVSLSAAAFFAGAWSPSYGIICGSTLALVVYFRSLEKKKLDNKGFIIPIAFCLLGLILYIAAPGNYEKGSVLMTSYIDADVYPSVVLALVVLAIYVKIGGTLKPSQYLIYAVLLISVALSFVTLVLLPFAPNGALLCTMILGIAAYCNMFYSVNLISGRYRLYGYFLCAVALMYDVFVILESQLGVE